MHGKIDRWGSPHASKCAAVQTRGLVRCIFSETYIPPGTARAGKLPVSGSSVHGRYCCFCVALRTPATEEMFARFFGGGTPEAADGTSPREEEGGGSSAPSETPQKDPAVASHISKMDSIIRCGYICII